MVLGTIPAKVTADQLLPTEPEVEEQLVHLSEALSNVDTATLSDEAVQQTTHNLEEALNAAESVTVTYPPPVFP